MKSNGVSSSNSNSHGTTRRRTSNAPDTHPFRDSYVSATAFSPPLQTKLPLYSHSYGGYGPVRPEDSADDAKKASPTGSLLRLAQQCRDCLQYCGCSNHHMLSTEGPDGDFYRDDFNDQSDTFVLGTSEDSGIWMNQSDTAGTIMAFMVWVLLTYSAVTITFLAETGGVKCIFAMFYVFFCCMALASHAKTTFSDPKSQIRLTDVQCSSPKINWKSISTPTPRKQCDQMVWLLFQYLAICNNEN